MIVTRQRRKPFPWRRLVLPSIVLVLVVVALAWSPSRGMIASGPAAPLWRTSGSAFDAVARPFHFAAQNEVIAQKARNVTALQGQLADAQARAQAKDKQIADLQAQVQQLQAQAATLRSTPTGAPKSASATAATFAAGAPSANETDAVRRTAAYWASMEPENAAKVVQRLPVEYVARVFAQMSSDAAGSILDALPPGYAAQLTQEHPELRR